jgi:hypothetical protein
MRARVASSVSVLCLVLAGCDAASPAPAGPSTDTTAGCELAPGPQYLVRSVFPATPAVVTVVGDADRVDCQPVLDTFTEGVGQEPGECTTLALASDNPGYDLNTPNPPPLTNVIHSAGPGC